MVKHRKENGPQPHPVGRRAERRGAERRKLQPAQRRDHAEGEERRESEQRKEHVQPAAPRRRAKAAPQGAQRVEHERERDAEEKRGQLRPRLLGDGHAHPKSLEKNPPPAAGSSA